VATAQRPHTVLSLTNAGCWHLGVISVSLSLSLCLSLSLSAGAHFTARDFVHMLGWLLEVWSSCAFACLTDWILVNQNKSLLRILSVLLLQFDSPTVQSL
jgi:ABC-type sugar transport system permease subunit